MRRTGHIRTKTLSILIVILSAFLISNIVVFATEDLDAENPNPGEILETEIEAEEIETITGGSLDEPEILLEQYIEEKAETIVEEAMNGEVGSETYPPASARYWKLGDAEKKAYLKIKEMLESIAAGETNDAEVTLTYAELYSDDILNAKYTAADLDVGDIALQNENGEWELTSEAMDIIVTKYPELNTRSIMTAISRDCPELLYWFDKTVGMISASGRFLGAEKNDEWTIWCTDKSYYSFGFWVADEYVGGYVTDEDGDECKYIVDTELTSSVNDALAYAAEIVSDNSSSSDIDKLTVYKDVICDQVSYNHGATAEGTAYGNPWQIIYVFDKDPNTNVVCEGYSKAFKFLCDLTSFKDSSLSCSIVTGLMGGGTGAGGHMWNIVSVGGKNYLVDVTNCDAGTIGAPDALFMVGNDSMAAATVNKNGKSYDSETYTFSINKTNVSYTYDADTVTIFDQ